MEISEKINVRGILNALEIGDEPLEFVKSLYKTSSIRSIATAITTDTGKRFSVSAKQKEKTITVKRVS